ncbi:hypothetical protein [Rossellomorea vietnamensis]|jgi:hypothetical protein|uniref:hypothetical protein n=1 Tax=Rossellomorea vietnamensis TaxID=218284 RepID=UPI000558BFDA|nr:hypothetical protein [Rossellomorea vietnamensis]
MALCHGFVKQWFNLNNAEIEFMENEADFKVTVDKFEFDFENNLHNCYVKWINEIEFIMLIKNSIAKGTPSVEFWFSLSNSKEAQ